MGTTSKSENGSALTVIDGNQTGSTVTFDTGEDQNSIIEGFTITNGTGTIVLGFMHGGGIFCGDACSPIITHNRIVKNNCHHGGGIHYGGRSSPLIVENEIVENTTTGNGAGMWCGDRSSATIANNVVARNTSRSTGGIFCNTVDAATRIDGNLITENEATDGFGGGIRSFGPALIINNIIVNNCANSPNTYAGNGGGIMFNSHGTVKIYNNIISGNSAKWMGGGIYCKQSDTLLMNNTIAGNDAGGGGGGIVLSTISNAHCVNTVFWENSAPVGPEIWVGSVVYLTFRR